MSDISTFSPLSNKSCLLHKCLQIEKYITKYININCFVIFNIVNKKTNDFKQNKMLNRFRKYVMTHNKKVANV